MTYQNAFYVALPFALLGFGVCIAVARLTIKGIIAAKKGRGKQIL